MFNFILLKSQTDVNWKHRSLRKYGHFFETVPRNQYKKNQEQINVSSRRKRHTMKKDKDSINETFDDTDWKKYRKSSQVFV